MLFHSYLLQTLFECVIMTATARFVEQRLVIPGNTLEAFAPLLDLGASGLLETNKIHISCYILSEFIDATSRCIIF